MAVTERYKQFLVKPFPYAVNVVASTEVGRSMHKKRLTFPGAAAEAANTEAITWTKSGSGHIWMFIPLPCSSDIIAHESLHAVHFVMKEVGAGFDEEIYAYHIGDLVGKIVGFTQSIEKKLNKNSTRKG